MKKKAINKVRIVHRTGLEPVRPNGDGLEDRNASNYVLAVHP